jgi:drug/metabolite transporter (DMT)-like permease
VSSPSNPRAGGSRPAVAAGVALAVLSAVAFGATTPWIARAGAGVGPFATAALLYAGAALAATGLRRFVRPSGARIRRAQAGRILAVAAAGAFVAPVAFAFGVQRTGPTTAALLLNLEATFTCLLAALWLGEPIGRRVALAVVAMAAGGGLLALDAAGASAWSAVGALGVGVAAAAWATDNVLSRPLAEHEPLDVVRWKALLGALASAGVAVSLREGAPSAGATAGLVLCGATGFGLSLRLYLLAQRRIGAARTASVFALAPFLGAAVSWGLGDRDLGPLALLGVVALALGVWLHVTERHEHEHVHEAIEHEHAHRHDDGHHDHAHDEPPAGVHTHLHRHGRVIHHHEHAPDVHHDHHR